jgi:hypothetical protein
VADAWEGAPQPGGRSPDAGALQDRTEDRRARPGLDPQRLGEGAAGAYDLVVEEGGVQALEADLRGLFQDAEVRGVAGEGGARAEVAGALAGADALAAGRRLCQANRYFSEGLAGEPARGGARVWPR